MGGCALTQVLFVHTCTDSKHYWCIYSAMGCTCFFQRGGTSGPLIYLIVLDTCMDDEDFQAVKVCFHTVYIGL